MQLTDKDGNVFGTGGLEITTSSGKPKIPVINTDITIGTTAVIGGVSGRVLYNNAGVVGELDLSSIYVPTSRTLTINGVTQDLSANRTFTISTGITIGSTAIASGTVGRILFEGSGNVVQESSGLTYNDTAKAFTLIGPVGSIIQHTALTNYNGLGGLQLNVADGTERAFFKLNPTSGEVRIGATGSGYFPTFYAQGVEAMRIFASTRNVAINTTTDAGFRFDVAGTARVQNTLSISNPSFTMGGSITHSANATLVITGGPGAGGENITFGPSNRIFINAQQSRFPTGSVQIAGTLSVGNQNATSTNMLLLGGSITAGSALGRGIGMDTTLVASANNDVLVGLDIAPTYTNGAFTGLANIDLRTKGTGLVIGSGVGYGALYGYNNDGIIQVVDGGTSAITGFSYATQLWLRPSGNAAGLNSNYWATIEQSTGGLYIQSGRYNSNLFLRTGRTGTSGNIYFNNAGGTMAMLFGATGNFAIATTTDSGFKFDVNGTARFLGARVGTLSLNSGDIGNTGTGIYSTGTDGTIIAGVSRGGMQISNWAGGTVSLLNSDNPRKVLRIIGGFSDGNTTGLTGNTLDIMPTYNFTGTQSPSTVKGIYYNPTLTSMIGVTHYAFHSTSGLIRFENLPTSAAGLPAGTLYNNLGVLMIA